MLPPTCLCEEVGGYLNWCAHCYVDLSEWHNPDSVSYESRYSGTRAAKNLTTIYHHIIERSQRYKQKNQNPKSKKIRFYAWDQICWKCCWKQRWLKTGVDGDERLKTGPKSERRRFSPEALALRCCSKKNTNKSPKETVACCNQAMSRAIQIINSMEINFHDMTY